MKHHFYNISVIIILSIIPFVSNYSQWQKYYIDNNLPGANQIRLADINLDGKLDIVISAENANQVVWYENKFPDWEKHLIGSNLIGVLGVATADIDGDDTVDVVACGPSANDVVWYENNHPTWTNHTIDNDFMLAAIPVVGDVNGDGNLDVIVNGGWENTELAWYENNDLQWNRNMITNATSSLVGNVYAIDIDKNGKIDIFSPRGDSLNIYESQDNGESWIKTTIDDNFKGSWDCFADYINDDNNLDIIGIAGGHSNGKGLFWYNKTDSIWIKNQIDNEYKNFACGLDFDGDGKNDIATTDDHKVNLYKNNLPNGWEKKVIDTNLIWAWHIKSADIDEDGFSDLIVSDWEANDLILYKNLSNMAYATSMEISDNYFNLHGDTITINATLENPEEHSAEVFAIINGDKDSFQDSIQLFDDGLHSDEDASDNIWGEKWLLNIPEDMYTVSLLVNDLTANSSYSPHLLKSQFTNAGPIVIDTFSIVQPNDSLVAIADLFLKNIGAIREIPLVLADLISIDSSVHRITNSRSSFGKIPAGQSRKSIASLAYINKNISDTNKFILQIKSGEIHYWTDTLLVILKVTDVSFNKSLPKEFTLQQNYPNPFNPSTTIKYSIPKQSNVILKVFDVLGSEVATLVQKIQPQGNYEIEFDGSELTSGIYFYQLNTGDFTETKKMILLK